MNCCNRRSNIAFSSESGTAFGLVIGIGNQKSLLVAFVHVRGDRMAEETIFSKIVRKEIPADIVYQDELVTAFRDINPQAPTHVLIIPNKVIPSVREVETEDEVTLGRLFTVAAKIAQDEGVAKDGYRLIVNCGDDGGQEVYHIHMHLLGGRRLGRMLSLS